MHNFKVKIFDDNSGVNIPIKHTPTTQKLTV